MWTILEYSEIWMLHVSSYSTFIILEIYIQEYPEYSIFCIIFYINMLLLSRLYFTPKNILNYVWILCKKSVKIWTFSKNAKIVIFSPKSAIFQGKLLHAVPLSGQRWKQRVIGLFGESGYIAHCKLQIAHWTLTLHNAQCVLHTWPLTTLCVLSPKSQ